MRTGVSRFILAQSPEQRRTETSQGQIPPVSQEIVDRVQFRPQGRSNQAASLRLHYML